MKINEEMGLFGKSKPADPKALVDEWSKKVRKEGYGLDRQIRQIQRQEQLAIKSIKDATKKGKYFIICGNLYRHKGFTYVQINTYK